MGQKVHPIGLRLGIIRTWDSRWFSKKNYAALLHEDIKIRKIVKERLMHAGVSKIEIERAGQKAKINIFTARPGIIIGKRGAEVDKLKKDLETLTGKQLYINIQEIRRPELDAQLVAENIALQLERRIAFRRAMKKAVTSALRLGAQGIKINCAGRLGGAEIARTEWYREGRVPLHTLRADIQYGFFEAKTTMGQIGVKVWIYKGEILPQTKTVA
ncbi:MAG: 30S ribosomal protein S3 [Nitrospirae bacterium GWC2_57_13]|jgi:small subunit ribosomal protein S3|nr:MAG: 30S ribosomal protein S3 [Nitrospirae bacterium GWC1_57_7]OGW28829.1 MAG: 30S ribosomal protein S3 [Nitrospirae bacterium GWC2_57_13]HAR46700.1 30S ribosomal protein S3 [Nitrospiraceae bacterium]